MKTMIAVVLFGLIALVASQGVHIVDQNPEVEARTDFTDTVRNQINNLKYRIRDRANSILSALGVNVVDHNTPPPTPVQFVDNNVNGVNVVNNSPFPSHVNVVDNNTPPPSPVQFVDNSVNGVQVVDNSPAPAPGILVDVDPGIYLPGINGNQDIDPGFNRPPRPNIRPPRPGRPGNFDNVDPGFNQPGGFNPGNFDNVDPGFSQPGGFNPGSFVNVDPGFSQPGINQRPDPGVYYRPYPWLRSGN